MNNGALAGEAANAQGSDHWDVANQTKIAAGRDKCNEFVGDMIEGVGREHPQIRYKDIRGWLFHMTRDPSAKEWATEAIPGYSAPMPVSSAAKGDVIAVGHTNNAQGRVGNLCGPFRCSFGELVSGWKNHYQQLGVPACWPERRRRRRGCRQKVVG